MLIQSFFEVLQYNLKIVQLTGFDIIVLFNLLKENCIYWVFAFIQVHCVELYTMYQNSILQE